MRGRLYDLMTAPIERRTLRRFREQLIGHATGDVLEVGAGTGHNLPYYPANIDRLDLAEPDPVMRRRLSDKARHHPDLPITVTAAGAEGPFPRERYDTIVGTLVLCTVPDPEAALAAMVAALAPGGRLIYIEHVRSDRRGPAAIQRGLAPAWSRIADGCQLDRQTHALMRSFGLVPVEKEVIRLPPPVHLAHAGVAVLRGRL